MSFDPHPSRNAAVDSTQPAGQGPKTGLGTASSVTAEERVTTISGDNSRGKFGSNFFVAKRSVKNILLDKTTWVPTRKEYGVAIISTAIGVVAAPSISVLTVVFTGWAKTAGEYLKKNADFDYFPIIIIIAVAVVSIFIGGLAAGAIAYGSIVCKNCVQQHNGQSMTLMSAGAQPTSSVLQSDLPPPGRS